MTQSLLIFMDEEPGGINPMRVVMQTSTFLPGVLVRKQCFVYAVNELISKSRTRTTRTHPDFPAARILMKNRTHMLGSKPAECTFHVTGV